MPSLLPDDLAPHITRSSKTCPYYQFSVSLSLFRWIWRKKIPDSMWRNDINENTFWCFSKKIQHINSKRVRSLVNSPNTDWVRHCLTTQRPGAISIQTHLLAQRFPLHSKTVSRLCCHYNGNRYTWKDSLSIEVWSWLFSVRGGWAWCLAELHGNKVHPRGHFY